MKLDLEQIKADRAAGSPGEWWFGGNELYVYPFGLQTSPFSRRLPEVEREANKSRASRTPDLEDALIEAVEALSQLSRKAELADVLGYGWREARSKALKALERFQCAQQTPP